MFVLKILDEPLVDLVYNIVLFLHQYQHKKKLELENICFPFVGLFAVKVFAIISRLYIQGDQFSMTVLFWYLTKVTCLVYTCEPFLVMSSLLQFDAIRWE